MEIEEKEIQTVDSLTRPNNTLTLLSQPMNLRSMPQYP